MNSIYGIKSGARSSLKGLWGRAIAITLICLVCGVYSFGPFPSLKCSAEELMADPSIVLDFSKAFAYDMAAVRSTLFFLLGAGVAIGECRCYLLLTSGQECKHKEVFSGLPVIVPAIGVRLLRWIITLLGTLCLVIPGIYLHYRYSLAPWLLSEGKAVTAKEAMSMSAGMMKGKILWMLALDVSFIGWLLLSLLTMGIGLIFLIPYHRAARALFYKGLLEVES